MSIDQEHWLALEYLHDRTAPDAVIIMRDASPLRDFTGERLIISTSVVMCLRGWPCG